METRHRPISDRWRAGPRPDEAGRSGKVQRTGLTLRGRRTDSRYPRPQSIQTNHHRRQYGHRVVLTPAGSGLTSWSRASLSGPRGAVGWQDTVLASLGIAIGAAVMTPRHR